MIKTIESCKRRAQLVAVALLLKRRKDKRIYIRELFQKRSENGEHFLLPDLENDPSYHHTYFRYYNVFEFNKRHNRMYALIDTLYLFILGCKKARLRQYMNLSNTGLITSPHMLFRSARRLGWQ